MRKLSLVLAMPLFVFANDISPKSVGVQFVTKSIAGKPMINFTLGIGANEFSSMNFSAIEATIVDVNRPDLVIAPAKMIYQKSRSTIIAGEAGLMFSYSGKQALDIIKAIKHSRIIFSEDNGSSFSISIAQLCSSEPEVFANLTGQMGCP